MQKSRLKFIVAGALSMGLVVSSVGVVNAAPPKKGGPKIVVVQKPRGHTGRNVGIGAAVVIGTIVASEAARASYRGDRFSCRQLERRCDDGQDWACRRLDVRGDC